MLPLSFVLASPWTDLQLQMRNERLIFVLLNSIPWSIVPLVRFLSIDENIAAIARMQYCCARSPQKTSYSHLLHLRQIYIKYAEKLRKIVFYIPNAHLSCPTSNIKKSLQFCLKPILARNKTRAQNFCTDLMGKKAWVNNHGSL